VRRCELCSHHFQTQQQRLVVGKKGTSLLLEEVNGIFYVLKLFIIRVDLQFLFFIHSKMGLLFGCFKIKKKKEDEIQFIGLLMELFVIHMMPCRKSSAKFCCKISLHYSLDYC